MGVVSGGGGSGGSQPFLLAQKTLTDDDVKALPTTPFEIIAAPAAGSIIVPIHGLAVFKRTADYSNIDPTAILKIVETNNTFSPDFLGEMIEAANDSNLSALLANGSSEMAVFSARSDVNQGVTTRASLAHVTGEPPELDDGQNIVLAAYNGVAGDFTGGNAANKLLVSVTYYVLTLPT